MGNDQFHEVYVSASLDVCKGRDPKGPYSRARTGEIPDSTGISAPYEAPEACEIEVNTGKLDIPESMEKLVEYVEKNFSYSGDV
jgi:bifunctional enzyme CysN/CysC